MQEFNIEKIKTFSLGKFKKVIGAWKKYENATDEELENLYEKLTGIKKVKKYKKQEE